MKSELFILKQNKNIYPCGRFIKLTFYSDSKCR